MVADGENGLGNSRAQTLGATVARNEQVTGNVEQERPHTCGMNGCTRSFETKTGLGVHRNSAHPKQHRAAINELLDQRTKVRWGEADLHLLAKAEAELMKKGVRFMNIELLKIFHERSLEAIKGQRKYADHKRRVAEYLANGDSPKPKGCKRRSFKGSMLPKKRARNPFINTSSDESYVSSDEEREVNGPTGSGPEGLGTPRLNPAAPDEGWRSPGGGGTAPGIGLVGTTPLADEVKVFVGCASGGGDGQPNLDGAQGANTVNQDIRATEQMFHEEFEQWSAEALHGLKDEAASLGIRTTHEGIDAFTRAWLKRNLGWERNPAPRKSNRPKPPRLEGLNRTRRKAAVYQYTQRAFSKDPYRCVKSVIDGTLFAQETIPEEVLEEFWERLFTKEPEGIELDRNPTCKPELRELAAPITAAEVQASLKKLKDNSPGLDGIKRNDLRKVNKSELRLLAMVFQAARYTPAFLRDGVVTLIPKKATPDDPGDYRPITITSFVLRFYHGILAKRMEALPLSKRQKAFLPRDGMAENAWIIDSAIRHAKSKLKELVVVFVDVSKAFDSLAHPALIQAAEMVGVPREQVHYLQGVYDGASVTFKGKQRKIRKNGGIQQGDSMSGPLFNAAMDKAYNKLDPQLGFRLSQTVTLTHVLFADDGIVLSGSRAAAQRQVDTLVAELRKQGFSLNAKKCATLRIRVDGRNHRTVPDNTPCLNIGGTVVPALSEEQTYKYLGLRLGCDGYKVEDLTRSLTDKLCALKTSGLKPQQKLFGLKEVVIPGLFHQLVLAFSPIGTLKNLDKTIRRFVREVLHLPKDVPKAAFHAHVKDGGLGVPALEFRVTRLRHKRWTELRKSDDRIVQAFLNTEDGEHRLRLMLRLRTMGGITVQTPENERRAWRDSLIQMVDGKGLQFHRPDHKESCWLTDPTMDIRGGDFIKAVHVRLSCLKTPSRAARGERADPRCRLDRQVANLNHITNVCQATHGLRVIRHNRLAKALGSSLVRNGYRVLYEPRIAVDRSYVKPDLVAYKAQDILILDPQVCGDHLDPDLRFTQKVVYYSREEVILGAQRLVSQSGGPDDGNVTVAGVIMNYRGAVSNLTAKLFSRIRVRPRFQGYLALRVLVDSWKQFYAYNCATSTR